MNRPIRPLHWIDFKVLQILGCEEQTGAQVRAALQEQGVTQTLAAFYMRMHRLKEKGLIEQRMQLCEIKSYPVRRAHYKVSGAAAGALDATRAWYDSSIFPIVRTTRQITGA